MVIGAETSMTTWTVIGWTSASRNFATPKSADLKRMIFNHATEIIRVSRISAIGIGNITRYVALKIRGLTVLQRGVFGAQILPTTTPAK
jgi:hypothetical protein